MSTSALAAMPTPVPVSHPSQVVAPTKRRVLLAEDNDMSRQQLQQLLQAQGLHVETVGNGKEALEAVLSRPYSVVVTDLKMPHLSGMELLQEIQKRRLPVAVIVTTGFGNIGDAVQAMRLGATDFLTKPVDFEYLRLVVSRALREREMLDELSALREQLHERFSFHQVLSKNPGMHGIFELIGHVGQTSTTVLIEGETGTGKEMIARAIHQASAKRSGPLVAVNCAALPENLLESELFGHEKGAFTSAISQRKGRFELADGGTIFLDEVGDVPASMQAKLLRVLQERTFERVGGAESIEVDVRVIAATNRDLKQLVKEGKFREDLYYRLNVVKIDLPPLRDRQEDIPLLAQHFAAKYTRQGTPVVLIAPEAMDILVNFRWPGNIRQLENAIERACVTARDGTVKPENLPPEVTQPTRAKSSLPVDLARPLAEQLEEIIAAFEERYLRKALRKTRGNVGRCAKISGLSRRSITDKLGKYKIDRTEFKNR